MGSQVLGVYVYAFFYEYTALSALNYASVYLGALVYVVIMAKFVAANRVAPGAAAA